MLVLADLAVVVTALLLLVAGVVAAFVVLSRPLVCVTGGNRDDDPEVVSDPADVGVRGTEVEVASPLPLTWVDARYRGVLPDAGLDLRGVSHGQLVAALREARVDDATFSISYATPGTPLAAHRPWPVFALALPLVRRLTALDIEVTFRYRLGRTLRRTVPALPKQPLSRPVRAEERAPRAGAA